MKIVVRGLIGMLLASALAQGVLAADPASEPNGKFVYKKTKQADLSLTVYYPPAWQAADSRPAIVFFFGGGWTSGQVTQFEPQAKYFASRGLVTACADYRVKSRHDVTPKECVEDAKSAIRWVRQNAAKLGVDPARIVAAGGSAGGHIAACTALTPGYDAADEDAKVSSRPNALLLFNPVLNFNGALRGRVGNDEQVAAALSPTLHLAKDTPPTLILFGSDDSLKAQGDEFLKKAKELGHATEYYVAEGEKHGFFNRPPWQQRTMLRADEFLIGIKYLSGPPTIKSP